MTTKTSSLTDPEGKCGTATEKTKAELFDLINSTILDGVVVADADGVILCFSPAAEEMFGHVEADLLGKNLSVLMPSIHAEQHDDYMQRYLTTGEKRIIGTGRNVVAMRKDGSMFAAHLEIGELKTEAEHLFVGFIRDRTSLVSEIDKSRRLERLLEQTGREQMVGEMSSALSHELNQPLTAITNFAKAAEVMLKKDEPDVAKAQSYLRQVIEQSLRSGEIMKRMRLLVQRGQAKLKPDDINAIIEEAVRVSKTGIDDSIRVHLDLGDDLPPVLADRIQIQQVVINLLRNAKEAVEGEAQAEPEIATDLLETKTLIELKARLEADEKIVVTIKDAGPGLPPELIATIFDPLVSTKQNGFGIGLAVCRSIIQAHGGHIWAENSPDGGASFHFTLRKAEDQ